MGFRFRKSVKILPGVRVNFGKTGASVSVGSPGATANFGKRGVRATVGLPGTGLSYTANLSSWKSRSDSSRAPPDYSEDAKMLFSIPGMAAFGISCALAYGLFRISHYHWNSFLLTMCIPFFLIISIAVLYFLFLLAEKYRVWLIIAILVPSLYLDYYASDYGAIYASRKRAEAKKALAAQIWTPVKMGYEVWENPDKIEHQYPGKKLWKALVRMMDLPVIHDYRGIGKLTPIRHSADPSIKYAHKYVKEVNGKRIPGTEITLIQDRELNGIKVEQGCIFD